MCGIAGMVSSVPIKGAGTRIKRMMDLLAHRGPDDEGRYEEENVCLGHRRLSIIDLSSGGHQPMIDGKNVLVFNGEIYNHNELRKEMELKGMFFNSRTDTEVLLRGYRVWGDKVVNRLEGMFAFALWDGERNRLYCGRDPFGKKPFYYYRDSRIFVFASEVEAVVAGLVSRPYIDYKGLSSYLLKGYFAPGRSVYESIHTLKAGHCLEVENKSDNFRYWPYWQARFEFGATVSIDHKKTIDLCGNLISLAVQRRLQSDVPVGVLLSGGVDSSLVTIMASAHNQSQIQTFNASFKGTSYDESRYAREVSLHADTNHTDIDVAMDNIPELISRIVKAYGEPFGDLSAIPTFCLFEGLKPYVKVALTGDGGDEVFAGYEDAKLFLLRSALSPILGITGFLGKRIPYYLIQSQSKKCRRLGFALITLGASGSDVFNSLRTEGWTSMWRKQLMRQEAWRLTGEDELENEDAGNFRLSGHNDLEMYLNITLERLIQSFLVKIDRASMAHSIEARCPLLDVKLFEWARTLPKPILFKNGVPKSILKELLDIRMGTSFSKRTKMGFTPPIGEWFRRDENIHWLERRLIGKDSFVLTLFEPTGIRRLISLHRKGQDHTGRLWRLLFLNEWHSHFFTGNSSGY